MDIKIDFSTVNYIPILLQMAMYSFDINVDDKIEKIIIKNIDGTEMEAEMSISDILYFTENGTLLTPPRPIIKNIKKEIENRLEQIFPEIINNVLNNNWEIGNILERFTILTLEINKIIIPQEISKMTNSNNSINNIIGAKNEDSVYLYDLKKLGKFIHCDLVIG